MNRVVVTGAAGFVGSHLVERLLATGAVVTGIDSLSAYYDPALKRSNLATAVENERFRLVEGDLNELELASLLDGAEVVYHLAGRPGVRSGFGREFESYVRDNVLATQAVLEAIRGGSVKRLVFASSSSVYGDAERFPTPEDSPPAPLSPYGVTKAAAENLCRLYVRSFGVAVVVLRYFTVYGPRQRPDMAFARFIDAALEGRSLAVNGDGCQVRDFTFVHDAVAAALAAGERGLPGRTYNVSGGSRASVNQAVAIIEELLDKPLAVEHGTADSSEPRATGADTTAAARDLGFQPRTALRAGLAVQLDHQRAAHAGARREALA